MPHDHRPPPPVAALAAPFVTEADAWLATEPAGADTPAPTSLEPVLIVEDSADMRAYLSRLLAPAYAVRSASSGREGLERALADPPAIVIGDVMLDGGPDGFDLLSALRRDARTRDTPVILISARADPDSAERALQLGADDYIVKPFGARELLARVRATVHGSHLRARAGEQRGRAHERALADREVRALADDLKAAHHRAAEAADAERRRIERDLHDGAQQRIMAIRLELGLLSERLGDGGAAPLRGRLERLRSELEEALDELRELARGLYPPLLASEGLHTALAAATRRSRIPVQLDCTALGRLPPAVENAAYFCCTEALQNVTKHAGPGARATIRLQVRHGALEFLVADDGVGFDLAANGDGSGLANLRDRVGALGGHVEIGSQPGHGTQVRGQMPLP